MPDKSNPQALQFDAYFTDEFGVINTSSNVKESQRIGLHKNIFTDFAIFKIWSLGTVIETSRSSFKVIKNMADPSNNSILTARKNYIKNPVEVSGRSHVFRYYFSESIINYWKSLSQDNKTWDNAKPINITLLFGVGTELNRSGIRSFFQKNNDFAAIILVPGVEPGHLNIDSLKKNKSRWGISLTDIEIAKILKDFFLINVPYKVVNLACYSTGMNGLNQTVLNEIIDLKYVMRIIIFDCLYLTSSGSTVETFRKIKNINHKVQIIIYWSSISKEANSLDNSSTRLLVVDQAKPIVTYSSNVIKVAGKKSYRALTCGRIVQAGIKENLLTLSANGAKAFQDFEKIIPRRGDVISDKNMFKLTYGSISGTNVSLDDWYTANKNIVEAFYRFIDDQDQKTPSLISQIWKKALLGYYGSIGSETHDLLIPEFGWEYLPYRK